MRPPSIINFERFYLGSVVLGVLTSIVSWDTSVAAIQAQSPPEFQFGSGFLIFGIVLGILISLLLWYFVAMRASVVAKWIIVVFFAIGAINFIPSVSFMSPLVLGLSIAGMVLEALAVWMLFRPDAKAWFGGPSSPSADTFS